MPYYNYKYLSKKQRATILFYTLCLFLISPILQATSSTPTAYASLHQDDLLTLLADSRPLILVDPSYLALLTSLFPSPANKQDLAQYTQQDRCIIDFDTIHTILEEYNLPILETIEEADVLISSPSYADPIHKRTIYVIDANPNVRTYTFENHDDINITTVIQKKHCSASLRVFPTTASLGQQLIKSDTYVNGSVTIRNTVQLQSLDTLYGTTLRQSLAVTGSSILCSNIRIDKAITSNLILSKKLDVYDSVNMHKDLTATGSVTFAGNLLCIGDCTFGDATTDTFDVFGPVALHNALTLSGSLSIPLTTAANKGVIYSADAPFIHSYGTNNAFFGTNAGNFTLTGNSNVGVGPFALQQTNSSNNTAVGFRAMPSSPSGYKNTALGTYALRNNRTGSFNTAVGHNALANNITGTSNTAIGQAALANNTTGTNNTATGQNALFQNTTGSNNTALGQAALFSNTTGDNNTACGQGALNNNTSGSNNIALGQGAGTNQTTGSNTLYIGNDGVAAESNTIRIGTAGTHTKCFISGIRGVTTTNIDALAIVIDASGQLGTIISSRRFKDNIIDIKQADTTLNALNPVSFTYINDSSQKLHYGLIAEEVENVIPELVIYDKNNQTESVNYYELPALIIAGYQEQSVKLANQQKTCQSRRLLLDSIFNDIQKFETLIKNKADNNDIDLSNPIDLFHDQSCLRIFPTTPAFSSQTINLDTLINGSLTVRGPSLLQSLDTLYGTTLRQSLTVTGSPVFHGTIRIDRALPNNLTISQKLDAYGSANIHKDLTVSGSTTIATNILVRGNDTFGNMITDTVDVWGSTATHNSLTATGSINLGLTTASGNGSIRRANQIVIHAYGTNNNFFGTNAGNFTLTGDANVGVGPFALQNTTTSNNTATGFQALTTNTTGSCNTAIGSTALLVSTIGSLNVAIGRGALKLNDDANANTACGQSAISTTPPGGDRNTTIGQGSLNVTTGSPVKIDNTALGQSTLGSLLTGKGNVGLGQNVSNLATSGDYNIILGQGTGNTQTTGSNTIYIHHAGVAAESNTIRIGTAGTQTKCFIAGIRGVAGLIGTSPVLIDSAGQLGTISSSRRFKNNIETLEQTGTMLNRLRPVTFTYTSDTSNKLHYGLIAEEVEGVCPELVVYDDNGQPETVAYHELPSLILAGYKEQQNRLLTVNATTQTHHQFLTQLLSRLNNLKYTYVLKNPNIDFTNITLTDAFFDPASLRIFPNTPARGAQSIRLDSTINGSLTTRATTQLQSLDVLYGTTLRQSMSVTGSSIFRGRIRIDQPIISNLILAKKLDVYGSTNAHKDLTTGGSSTFIQNIICLGNGTFATASNKRVDTWGPTTIHNALTVTGSITLPPTTNTGKGVIYQGGNPFIHFFGTNNNFLGTNVANFAVTNDSNLAVGPFSLQNTTTAGHVAIGFRTLSGVLSGNRNTAAGTYALRLNTSGTLNAAVGDYALKSNTSGIQNTALGQSALEANTSASNNTACGQNALQKNTVGSANSAYGQNALQNSTASNNTGIGAGALNSTTSGASNTAVGQGAGTNQTTGSNSIYIGNDGVAAESATIRIGAAATHTSCFISGIQGVTTTNANAIPALIDSAGQLGTVSSSRRFKTNIVDIDPSDITFNKLNPVSFTYKNDLTNQKHYGLIAEEVENACPELVIYGSDGLPEAVAYHELPALIITEHQNHEKMITEQEAFNHQELCDLQAIINRLAKIETHLKKMQNLN